MQQTTHRAHYPVRVQTFWSDLCLSLEYQEQLYKECLGCESMEVIRNDGDVHTGVTRSLRFRKPIEAPGPIRKMFGNAVTMEEEGTFDAGDQTFTFVYRPPLIGDRFSVTGVMRTEPEDQGVRVTTSLTFDCRLLGLGGLIERFAVNTAQEGIDDKMRFTQRYIEERRLT